MPRHRISRVNLVRFKGFRKFTLHCRDTTFLVGPNNAGKSTLIEALSLAADAGRIARSRVPERNILTDRWKRAYVLDASRDSDSMENLRFELEDEEARITVVFSNSTSISLAWPPDKSGDNAGQSPYMFIAREDGSQPTRPLEVRQSIPQIGIVPVLGPVEPHESLLKEKYLRENFSGRLTSRHFRNQLLLLKEEPGETRASKFDEYCAFVYLWTPEIGRLYLERGSDSLALYIQEPDSRNPREVAWSGDGMQIWLQLLLHLYRLQDVPCVVIDEPDVFLHSDLQKRLVSLLETFNAQVITATHSPEVLAEASPESVVLVDKSRPQSQRTPSRRMLEQLSGALGTNFNLRLARALKTKVVLMVEGQDLKLLRNVAATLGAQSVARELGITQIPLEGFDRWPSIEPFSWLIDELLDRSVKLAVILDRDYRPKSRNDAIIKRLREMDAYVHIWERKELESYFLVPSAMARLAGGTDSAEMLSLMKKLSQSMKVSVSVRAVEEAIRYDVSGQRHRVTISEKVQDEIEQLWPDLDRRLALVPPKKLLAKINDALDADKKRTISFRALSRAMQADEVPGEMATMIREVEALLP
jgi:predicted ATPase